MPIANAERRESAPPAMRRPQADAAARRAAGRPSISIFTTAKPFVGHSATIQHNALRSWSMLSPRPEILLVGEEEGYDGAALLAGAGRFEQLQRNELGTPLLSHLFEVGHARTAGEVLVFANADLILPPELPQAVAAAARRFTKFLLVGRRVDLDVRDAIDFTPGWWERLSEEADLHGVLRGDLCIDYLVFSRELFGSVPPFAIGRTRYDNWLVWRAAQEGAEVIDCSRFLRVIHQAHDYGHVGGARRAWEGPEAKQADQLLGHWSHYESIAHARYAFDEHGEIRPARGWRYSMARPRRAVSHALRFTRPLRRRVADLRARKKFDGVPVEQARPSTGT